ncbi:MAG: LemA family protein, partial [Elusimicrobia bacterium]|nr:LemA family protein [Elusimicrobiota bacterium]MBD3412245.1 LemA family protein [Elusimicrobiota bacterium]
ELSWSQVENVLQRRYDLIPNLVNTVKGYAKHERELFEQFAEARKMMAGARSVNEKMRANDALSGALSRLMVVVEQYPNLKANESFQKLMDELAGTENRIAVERKRYNDSVGVYNIMVKRFPGNIVASIFNFEQKSEAYFQADEQAQEAPKVEF